MKDITLCKNCNCMTHTLKGLKCGKCGELKILVLDNNPVSVTGYLEEYGDDAL